MEFTFDVSQTPLIGRRILLKSETGSIQNLNRGNNSNNQAVHLAHNTTGTPNSPRRSTSLSPADTAPMSGWKRPWLSQSRVRECLVNLLTTCGQRVGLPKSPSVSIRSQGFCIKFNYYTIQLPMCALEPAVSMPFSWICSIVHFSMFLSNPMNVRTVILDFIQTKTKTMRMECNFIDVCLFFLYFSVNHNFHFSIQNKTQNKNICIGRFH